MYQPTQASELLTYIQSAKTPEAALRSIDTYVQEKIEEHMDTMKAEFNAHWVPCAYNDVLTEGSYLIRLQHGTTVWYKEKKVYKGQQATVSHLCSVAYMVIPEFKQKGE